MAESTGHSFESITDGGASACYFKLFPTQENLDAGGIDLVSGELPSDIAKLFARPIGNTAKIIKINVTDPKHGAVSLYISVHSSNQLKQEKNLYKAELWFCPQGQATPNGFDILEVSKKGIFKTSQSRDRGTGNRFTASVIGKLKGKNDLSYSNFQKSLPKRKGFRKLLSPGGIINSVFHFQKS